MERLAGKRIVIIGGTPLSFDCFNFAGTVVQETPVTDTRSARQVVRANWHSCFVAALTGGIMP